MASGLAAFACAAIDANDAGFRVRVGPFTVAPAADPLFARVLTRLVDEAAYVASENGGVSYAELVVTAARHVRGG